MWEFRKGNVFAPRTFISYGALLGYAAFYAEEIPGEHHGTAAGWFLIVVAIITTPSWSRHYERQRVLALLDLAVALLGFLVSERARSRASGFSANDIASFLGDRVTPTAPEPDSRGLAGEQVGWGAR